MAKQRNHKLFIGSSVEGLPFAYAIQENLEHDRIDVTVWTQGFFHLSQSTLSDLIKGLSDYDLGAFVLTPDDIVILRSQEYTSARDNVIFELGLFFGALGQDRAFYVIPRSEKNFRLPTDLLGIAAGTYDDKRGDNNLAAALGSFSNQIRKAALNLEIFSSDKPRLNHQTIKSLNQPSNPSEMKDKHEFYTFYQNVFIPIYSDFVAATREKPEHVLIEESNMLSHIVAANNAPNTYEDNMNKALAHLFRASIDTMKLFIMNRKDLLDNYFNQDKVFSNLFKKKLTSKENIKLLRRYLKAEALFGAARQKEATMGQFSPQKILDSYSIAGKAYYELFDEVS